MNEQIAKINDNEFQPLLKKVLAHPDVDALTKYYIGQSGFYVEHDLADDRNPAIRLMQITGALNDEDFYKNVYKGEKPEAEALLRELGKVAKKLLKAC